MLSIVLPCYNEMSAISEMLTRLMDVRLTLHQHGHDIELIVVNDGSSDRSAEVLKQFKNVRVVNHDTCTGYGAALKSGFSVALGEWIVFLDMDCTYQPEEITNLYFEARNGQYDMVFGRRQFWRSGMPWIRALGNEFFAILVSTLFGKKVNDPCSGFRVFRAHLRSDILALDQNGLNFSMQLTLHSLRSKWQTGEVKIVYKERSGQSKLSWWLDGFRFLSVVFKHKWESLCARSRSFAQ